MCSQLYLFLKCRLGQEFTEPVGAHDLARFRLVDMFSACTHPKVKDSILNSFCIPTSNVRVVIATIAFGMGLDCPNVRRVFHWGPSGDIELYLQETVAQVETCFLLKQFCTMVGKALLSKS